MAVFPIVEIRAYQEDAWYDVTDYVLGELVFTEGYDVDTLSGALPAIAPSTLTFSIDATSTFGAQGKRRFVNTPWIERFSPGAQCRLRLGSTPATGVTRFVGTLVRRDDRDGYTFDTEWANDIWRLTSERPDEGTTTLINYNLQHMWQNACRRAGIPEELISYDDNLGNTQYSIILRPGLAGIKQVQDLSGGLVLALDNGKIHLQSENTRLAGRSKRTYYEPGGEVAGTAIPPVKTLNSIFGVMNSLTARIFTFSPDRSVAEIGNVDLNNRYGIGERNVGTDWQFPYTYKERVSIQTNWTGLISDLAIITFAGEFVFSKDISTRLSTNVVVDDAELEHDIDFDRPNGRTFNGTYTLNFTLRPGLPPPGGQVSVGRYTIVISNASMRHDTSSIWLEFDYTATVALVSGQRTNFVQDLVRTPSFGIQGIVVVNNEHSTSFQTQEFDYTFEDGASIQKYGRKEREFPLDIGLHATHPLGEDYKPSESDAATIARRARAELNLFSEPTPVYQAFHDDFTGLITRRMGDKETLKLENGSKDLFVGNIEHHFNGELSWQIVYYWPGDFVRAFEPPPPPPAPTIRPFHATATWDNTDLDIVITDGTSNEGGVRYKLTGEHADGTQRIANATSELPAPPAAQIGQAKYTFTEAGLFQRVTITRLADDYEIVIMRADFMGTYVPHTTYPSFSLSARWSGPNLLPALQEAAGAGRGNNTYTFRWFGGVNGSKQIITNTAGAWSDIINAAYGITSIQATRTADGETETLLASAFTGTYTPRAFTTSWRRLASDNYFHYTGWIQDAPGGSGGVPYKIEFTDVIGRSFTWSARSVSNSSGRVDVRVIGHTRAITVIKITRLLDGHFINYPLSTAPPPTGDTDSFPAYRFTATWNRTALILRIQELGDREDDHFGGTEFRLTSTGLSSNINLTRDTSQFGAITYTIPNAGAVQSVTATRTSDNHSTSIVRAHFLGQYVAPQYTVNIAEVHSVVSNISRFTYTITITDAAGTNKATQYRVESTFAGLRNTLATTTSGNDQGTWEAVVTRSHHSQGYSNIVVTRLEDSLQVSTDRDNYHTKAVAPRSSVIVDEHDDGVHQGIRRYNYRVEITDPTNAIGGGIDYTVQYVQGSSTLDARGGRTGSNKELTVRFGTERTRALAVIVTRTWDGQQIRINQSQFNPD